MRTPLLMLVFSLAPAAFAANGGNPPPIDMKHFAGKMGEMQACLEKLDQGAMDRMRTRSESRIAEIRQLCRDGKRDEAQDRAMSYAKEMRDSPELKQITECSKILSMKPSLPQDMNPYKNADLDNRHVCDMK